MLTKALRLYGKNDLRTEAFELPPIREDEILAKVICDSLCMSSYKAAIQGEEHKRVPADIACNPIILGHEFCGEIVKVGAAWKKDFCARDRFAIQPALNYKGTTDAPGYSFPYIGGCATYIIIPHQVMELGCLLRYDSKTFFYGSLAEPLSCVIGSFKEFFHTKPNVHDHIMGIKPGGTLAILAGAGPMGLAAIDYAVHAPRRPARIVVTDIDEKRLNYAQKMLSISKARQCGVDLFYINTASASAPLEAILALNQHKKFDDVLVMTPVRSVAEIGDRLLATNGCLSFFAGPPNKDFSATVNFYNIHYASTHIIGTVGGNTQDMQEAIEMSGRQLLNPAMMVTHIGGLNSAGEATLRLPDLPGGKKLIYTHIDMALTAIADFAKKGLTDPFYLRLNDIVQKNNGLWCPQAEKFLLSQKSPGHSHSP